MSDPSKMAMVTTQRDSRPRLRLNSTRTLLVVIALIAGLFWARNEYLRRLAVSLLIARLPEGVYLHMGTGPGDRADQKDKARFLQSIGRIKGRNAEPIAAPALALALGEARRKRDVRSSQTAIACLFWIGPDSKVAVPELILMLREPEWPGTFGELPDLKAQAINGLATFGAGDQSVVPALVAALTDRERDRNPGREGVIATAAACALGHLGTRASAAVPDLTNGLKDPNPWVRAHCAVAIGEIVKEHQRVIELLTPLAVDPDEYPRMLAKRVLDGIEFEERTNRNRDRRLKLLAEERNRMRLQDGQSPQSGGR